MNNLEQLFKSLYVLLQTTFITTVTLMRYHLNIALNYVVIQIFQV